VQTRTGDVAILDAVNVYRRIYKYAVATRLSHWLWVVAFGVLVSSGMQIFNATPHLDASDGSDPARRVLSIDDHGAPVRLRVPTQLGYKSAKWVQRIEVVGTFARLYGGNGGYWEDQRYEWYAGI
jgi:hypothetical protein